MTNITPNRDNQHGGMEPVGDISQRIKISLRHSKNWYLLTPGEQEALDMIAHKIARILCGSDPHDREHWIDVAGYVHAARRSQEGGAGEELVTVPSPSEISSPPGWELVSSFTGPKPEAKRPSNDS